MTTIFPDAMVAGSDWCISGSLEFFASGGDWDLIRDLIDLFLESGAAQIEALREAAGRGDLASLAKLSHSLKGSAHEMGAREIARLSAELEREARERRPLDYGSAVNRIGECFGEVARTLRTYRNSMPDQPAKEG